MGDLSTSYISLQHEMYNGHSTLNDLKIHQTQFSENTSLGRSMHEFFK